MECGNQRVGINHIAKPGEPSEQENIPRIKDVDLVKAVRLKTNGAGSQCESAFKPNFLRSVGSHGGYHAHDGHGRNDHNDGATGIRSHVSARSVHGKVLGALLRQVEVHLAEVCIF